MSIVISNVGYGHHDNPCVYEVCINDEPRIALFEHVPSDGLAECLRKAAEAVDKAQDHPNV